LFGAHRLYKKIRVPLTKKLACVMEVVACEHGSTHREERVSWKQFIEINMELCKILTHAFTLIPAELSCTILRHAETSVPTETSKFISNNATVTFRELQRCRSGSCKDGGIVRWLVVNWDQTEK